jgi:hypothetical protein
VSRFPDKPREVEMVKAPEIVILRTDRGIFIEFGRRSFRVV